MEIGRYYLRRGEYVAAINRFRNVIDRYQTTTHVPEALHRLTEAYLALGVQQEARRTAAVLGYNFPGSEWYQDSYALFERRCRSAGERGRARTERPGGRARGRPLDAIAPRHADQPRDPRHRPDRAARPRVRAAASAC